MENKPRQGGQVQGLSGSLNTAAALTSKYLQKVFFWKCHSEQVLANKIGRNLLNIALIKTPLFDQSLNTSLKLLQAYKTQWKLLFLFSFPATENQYSCFHPSNTTASTEKNQLQAIIHVHKSLFIATLTFSASYKRHSVLQGSNRDQQPE